MSLLGESPALRDMTSNQRLWPPELTGNHCHIAPEWESAIGQKLWFVNAPYSGTVLRFRGEPTSLLYAIAPVVDSIKRGRCYGLTFRDVALLNPTVASDLLYSEMESRLAKQELRAICVSSMTAGSPEARHIARIAKKVSPRTITIFGGAHEDDIELKSSVDPAFHDLVDFTIAGDGEYGLAQLLEILFQNVDANVEDVKALALENAYSFASCAGRGALYFRLEGKTHQLPFSQRMIPLDTLPRMPRELLHEADTRTFSVFKRAGENVKTAQVMTHRGCAWRCSFCSESAALNLRSVSSVVEEIEEIKFFGRRHPNLARQDYGAIFFDDSTFTTRSPRRREFLKGLFGYLSQCGLEWGCQTRLDQIDETILREMRDAGCTYLYTGLESASDEMLRTMVKDETRKQIETAFEAVNRVGIRLGVSLIFGVARLGSNWTPENRQTIQETIDFVERQTQQGNIHVVSPNIATYYPGTRMTTAAGESLDFRTPVVNRGYPWNRFEEGESYHPDGITREDAEFIISESVRRFGELVVEQDLHSVREVSEVYRSGELEKAGRAHVDLNHASIGAPLKAVRIAVQTMAEMQDISQEDRQRARQQARVEAASLIGMSEEESAQVVLARNTTEAAGLAGWVAKMSNPLRNLKVLTTNAENISISRAFRFHMDHGNPQGRDLWSSYQDYGVQRRHDYATRKRSTGFRVREIDVLSAPAIAERKIIEGMTADTDFVVFSHVLRDTGRILDVPGLCKEIHRVNPAAHILVDGAQALGALPQVKFDDLGCDFYVAAPHKTLGSFPLGLLYMTARAKTYAAGLTSSAPDGVPLCILMEGMFDPRLKVVPSISNELSHPEVVSFIVACKTLRYEGRIRGCDCTALDRVRRRLKEAFVEALGRIDQLEIISPLDDLHSNFIFSFRFLDGDNRRVAERLWREYLVFVTYVARTDVIRLSFGPENTREDVRVALDSLCAVKYSLCEATSLV